MEEFLINILNLVNDLIYLPIFKAFENSDIINYFLNLLNQLFLGLFGNQIQLTLENLAAGVSVTLIIICIVIIVKMFIFAFDFVRSGLDDIKIKKGKKRR